MANTVAPFGLLPFGRMDGGSPTAGLTKYLIASSDPLAVFCGDTVHVSTTNNKYITVDSSGNIMIVGVFVGCEYYSPTVGRQVWSRWFPGAVQTGGPDVLAYVIDDPDQLFIVQASTNGIMGSSLNGLNFNVTPSTAGNQLTGASVLALASTTGLSTSAGPFRLVGPYSDYAPPGSPNISSTEAAAVWVVMPNNWNRKNLTAHST